MGGLTNLMARAPTNMQIEVNLLEDGRVAKVVAKAPIRALTSVQTKASTL